MKRERQSKPLAFVVITLASAGIAHAAGPSDPGACDKLQCTFPPSADCLPSRVGVACFEQKLDAFLESGGYSGWVHDREIRSTGPYINGASYGTHPAVKIYYSPALWDWMIHGRQNDIPDGAMIVKEQYPLPAQPEPSGNYKLQGWSIMVRDNQAAWDGWYWSSGAGLGNPSPYRFPFNYPWAGFGQYCANCHASADNTQLTYSSVRNVVGDPMTYLTVIPSMIPRTLPPDDDIHRRLASTEPPSKPADGLPQPPPDPVFMALYDSIKEGDVPEPFALPSESYDEVVQGPRPNGHKLFLTSDQCIGCHDGTQSNSTLPNMVYMPADTQTTINLSPYGEWRASLMGLSGRDPIFFAQLETERALFPELGAQIDNKCFSCHGVMGQRQIATDSQGKTLFTHDLLTATPADNPHNAAYGALARDGVSCTVCHRIAAEGLGTPATYTGQFKLGKLDELYGPYTDVATLPMQNALGLLPKSTAEKQIQSAALCGSCHTVEVPVLSDGGASLPDPINHPNKIAHEQSTYFEWRNSIYSNETAQPPPTAKTCQQCHMPGDYRGDPLQFRIANIEDNTFAYTDNRAPDSEITLRIRGSDQPDNPADADDRYARHTLVGVNLFAMRMFRQYYDSIGLRYTDPMATFGDPEPGMVTAENASLELATQDSATIEIASLQTSATGLEAQVKVVNKAGHKFPSGVGFRRAFIEFQVLDAQRRPLWASGRTNALGVILDGVGDQPLASEFFAKNQAGQQSYQPYYAAIDAGDQVQIYEELYKNSADGVFTTSFLSLAHEVKDTRLMPQGWQPDGPDADATKPNGGDGKPVGASYLDGSGADIVTYQVNLGSDAAKAAAVSARLYYQSIPPYYLQQRFATAPQGTFTRNLWYYGSRLGVNAPGSPIASWKLKVTEVERNLH